jgi:hypothetical protein
VGQGELSANEKEILAWHRSSDVSQRLATIPGIVAAYRTMSDEGVQFISQEFAPGAFIAILAAGVGRHSKRQSLSPNRADASLARAFIDATFRPRLS